MSLPQISKTRRARRVVENAAPVEIEQGAPSANFFLMISTRCLEKAPQKTLRFSHIFNNAHRRDLPSLLNTLQNLAAQL
jgi:hypothetical protein